MKNLFDLSGKVAMVTGASSGLGRDAARAYAEYGADLVLCARRQDRLEEVAKEIEAMGRKAVVAPCDVVNEEQVKAAVQKGVDAFGKIDILLNNAGIAIPGTVEELTLEDWHKGMDINVTSIFLTSKYVVPHMKKNKYGKIVNIASVNAELASKNPLDQRHVYNASKKAVLGITMAMAAVYMQDGITVNAIGPGLFESEMTENTLFTMEGYLDMYNAVNPASRPGKRGELNGTILYFSSDASSYVTNQFVLVDGGLTMV